MTDHPICDACKCVSHCRKTGCIPITPMPPVVRAVDDLDRIDAAIGHLQHARRALNQEKPEIATGWGYVQDAVAVLTRVPA